MNYILELVDCCIFERWYRMNFWLSQQPLSCIQAIETAANATIFQQPHQEMLPSKYFCSPLQIHDPLPSEVNIVIKVAGGEVYHGLHNKKVGREWARGYKASNKQNKFAQTTGGLINRTEIR